MLVRVVARAEVVVVVVVRDGAFCLVEVAARRPAAPTALRSSGRQ